MTWRAVMGLAMLIGGAVAFLGYPEHLRMLPEPPRSEAHVRHRASGEEYGSVVREEFGARRLAARPQRALSPADPPPREPSVVAAVMDLE